MIRLFAFFLLSAPLCPAQTPVETSWLLRPAGAASTQAGRALPEVHSVRTLDCDVELRTAGISLHYLGLLQTPVNPVERLQQFRIRVPLRPLPAGGAPVSVRADVAGVFRNGLPIPNHFEAVSWRGQNIWHFDTIAMADDGTLTAAGLPRAELTHAPAPGLLEALGHDGSRHSPLIGYAFDGSPIYGPWAWADDAGQLRRMRSGYRLRRISKRTHWPDGTELTPGQQGPDVSAAYPLGAFVEDYEYVAGSGALDQFNGRFAHTPEYPDGVYAYFMTTDAAGRLAFPYLLARQYHGAISPAALAEAFVDTTDNTVAPPAIAQGPVLLSPARAGEPSLSLRMSHNAPPAGQPVRLRFQARNAQGAPLRHLEYVHERPLHLLIVSEDLAEFAHIHPALTVDDSYDVMHVFPRGGRYRLYADYTAPGFAQRVETFDLTVTGKTPALVALRADKTTDNVWTKQTDGLQLTMTSDQPWRAGADTELRFALRDQATGGAVDDLQPYLGAWGHFVLIDQTRNHFVHAHPMESARTNDDNTNAAHTHHVVTGPPPAEIRVLTSFPVPGLYKLWAQFQRAGRIVVIPLVVNVAAATVSRRAVETPADAIRIEAGATGYSPARVEITLGRPVKLAFVRKDAGACGSTIVFPELDIRRSLPAGETVVIEMTPRQAGELRFTCGMGMYKGSLIVRAATDP
ncbi:MAG: YHYH protein [Blastocatellia bacterium]